MKSILLWVLAFILMFAAAGYQRRTGPSYPARGEIQTTMGVRYYELPRSAGSDSGARITIPAVAPAGTLEWRRYPTGDAFQAVPLEAVGDSLTAVLPPQPPAGKVEYYLELDGSSEVRRIPAAEAVVLRHRGNVSFAVLIPHVLLMFISMLIALRAALGVLAGRTGGTLAWVALAGFTVGGLVLGPIVQQQAFGAYWTGVPFGWDLTDNKTLIMWLAWLLACLVPLRRPQWRKPLVLGAAVITLVVYLIPHSMRGSQLDYTDEANPPAAASLTD
jgi:hypothetical protein